MNEHDVDGTGRLSTLMGRSTEDAWPDLDRLVTASTRDGVRIRRRRALVGAGVGLAAASVAAVAVNGVVWPGGPQAVDVAPATGTGAANSDPNVLEAGQTFDLAPGVVGTVVACEEGAPLTPTSDSANRSDELSGLLAECQLPTRYQAVGGSMRDGTGVGFAVVMTGAAEAVEEFWSAGFVHPVLDGHGGLTYAVRADSPLVEPAYDGQSVTIDVPGWRLVGEVADDKQTLRGPGGAVATLVWRSAGDYAQWIAAGKGEPRTWTSEVHGSAFITIQGGSGASAEDISALGESVTLD